MKQIREYFESTSLLSDRDWECFASMLTRSEYPKKHLLLSKGETEGYLSFIEKGIVRMFIPKEYDDLTFGFSFENSFTSAYDSFLTRQPSVYSIETLASTTLWRISFKDLQKIYEQTAVGNLIGRKASEELFLKKSRRELSLLSESAETRYLKLFTEQPELVRQIPLKYIASYIGITPQALSRIRRRIS
ncbi:cyclic nucleotide-binding domain-containing protein [Flavobacterium sp. Sd200]|uniref:Crp/Fnr family transcriptional regulator n=1 Tax=Flavobacterium sp. Sd200 TaxID=2692211 RepID=UPI00136CDB05|nr:Crp/Fnr family transcriptional regulator [Flavobacterium sp. Sd200]MXN91137.1 cyclic nucleotide-binding domain-containing protein [Flavobacterium sp. Sd200]